MKIFRNRYIPFKGFIAINLFGCLLVHPGVYISNQLMTHERIHTAQMRELGYVFFYFLYVAEWVLRLFKKGNAYRNISFEREAYDMQDRPHYLEQRKHYAWVKYMNKRTL